MYMARLVVILTVFLAAQVSPAAEPPLAERARSVLEQHCQQCHGKPGAGKGGFDYLFDREKLVARKKLVPGKPDDSEMFHRIVVGEMPPRGKPRLADGEVKLLREWIAAGGTMPGVPVRPFVGPAELEQRILADLQTIPARQRKFMRYVSFLHFANAGRQQSDLQSAQAALAKLVNSLSWHAVIHRPHAVDNGLTLFRLDLRDYRWTARTWDRIVTSYPYRTTPVSDAGRKCASDMGTDNFSLRGDWLVANASRGKLYYDMLELPVTDRALERLLQVDVPRDIQEETAIRAGFNGSGVARNNRVLERHDAAFGAYWRSYDFSENTNRQNVFDFPLGPATGRASFKSAGGEIIFHLPNGLQGYMLIDGAGRRIEKGAVEVVSDPQRPDKQVEVGVSCMNCHGAGLLPKEDQVRAHAEKNVSAFTREDLEVIRALYVPVETFRAAQERDNKRYQTALTQAGVDPKEPDPVLAMTLRYENVVDLAVAASELGVTADALSKRIEPASAYLRLLGPLKAGGGTVQRQVFEESFPRLYEELRRSLPTTVVAKKSDEPAAFVGHTDGLLTIAVADDGQKALSAGHDHTVRLWDVRSGSQLRLFEGHTAAVRSVALSADGQLALSCGDDRVVYVWDLTAGKEFARLTGHVDRVRAVAFSPDGKYALSGGDDRSVRVWDVRQKKELRAFTGHASAVTCVSVSPDGKRVLSGDRTGVLCLWNMANGSELRRWDSHRRGVLAVSFSPDGKHAVSGGEDRVARVWEASTGKAVRELEGHVNAVLSVRYSMDGSHIYTGSGQNEAEDRFLRIWDASTGQSVAAVGGPARVWCVAFTADGSQALTGGSERSLRLWTVKP